MPLFLFNRINLHISFSFITFVLSKLNNKEVKYERKVYGNKSEQI